MAQLLSKARMMGPAVIAISLIVLAGIQIINSAVVPVADQKDFIGCRIFTDWYGTINIERSISCAYILDLYNYIAPHEIIAYNAGLRVIAMICYLVSGSLLFWRLTGPDNKAAYVLCMILLYTSRFVFLWYSIEVFTGAFLMLFLWSLLNNKSFVIHAIFIVLFSLTKPELLVLGLTIGLVLAFFNAGSYWERLKNSAVLVGVFVIILIPAFIESGVGCLSLGWRAIFSLGQHYAVLISPHQVVPVNADPWDEYQKYFSPIWGSTHSIKELIVSHRLLYWDFIWLSLGRTSLNWCSSNLIFLSPLALYSLCRPLNKKLTAVCMLFFLGLIPITLFSWMHVRYAARFYPLLLTMNVFALLALKQKKQSLWCTLWLLLICMWQLYTFMPMSQSGYFFPD